MMSKFGTNGLIETGAGVDAVARVTGDEVPAAVEDDHTAGAVATTITTNRNASGLNPLPRPAKIVPLPFNRFARGSATHEGLNTMPRLRTPLGLTGGLGVPL